MLLYMQPNHTFYKIKHCGHFKIKAHHLLERDFSVILHSSYCLLLWSCEIIHSKSRTRGQFVEQKISPAKDLSSQSPKKWRKERRKRGRRNFVQGKKKKNIRDPIFDGWQQLTKIFLGVLSSLLMLCPLHFYTAFRKAHPVYSFIPAPIGPSILSTWACLRDKNKKTLQIQII